MLWMTLMMILAWHYHDISFRFSSPHFITDTGLYNMPISPPSIASTSHCGMCSWEFWNQCFTVLSFTSQNWEDIYNFIFWWLRLSFFSAASVWRSPWLSRCLRLRSFWKLALPGGWLGCSCPADRPRRLSPGSMVSLETLAVSIPLPNWEWQGSNLV